MSRVVLWRQGQRRVASSHRHCIKPRPNTRSHNFRASLVAVHENEHSTYHTVEADVASLNTWTYTKTPACHTHVQSVGERRRCALPMSALTSLFATFSDILLWRAQEYSATSVFTRQILR